MIMALGFLVFFLLLAVPFWVLLPRAGYTPYLALLCLLIPAGPIILLWLLAFNARSEGGS